MVNRTLNNHIAKAKELKDTITALEKELKKHTDLIKDEFTDRDITEYVFNDIKATYKEIISNRFDQKSFKAAHPELAKEYTKESSSMRFTIA